MNTLRAITALITVSWAGLATAAPLRVTTTLSSYSDIVSRIGANAVEAVHIVPPGFDPHFINPRPSDVLRVKGADLFVHTGLDLEVWRHPLVDAAARADLRQGGLRQLDLSAGIKLLELPTVEVTRAAGDIHIHGNPHYWLDPRNGVIIAERIAGKLSELDPDRSELYQANLKGFTDELQSKIAMWRSDLEPYRGREFIGHHNGWQYLMAFAGLRMELYLEPKPGIPPTSKHIAALIEYIHDKDVVAIVRTGFDPKDAARRVSAATEAEVITLSTNVGEIPEADSYIAMMQYNVERLLEVLRNHRIIAVSTK